MALQGKIEKITNADGADASKFIAEFTNGTVEQLRELATFLRGEGFVLPEDEKDCMVEVLNVGIGWLERLKNQKSGKAQ